MTPKRIAVLIIALLFAIIILQNSQVVELRLLFWSAQVSRALVLLATFILGVFTGWLLERMRKRAKTDSAKTES
jgi:uncharacterized integral membrane protein